MAKQKEILFWCVSYKHLRKLIFYYSVTLLVCCYGSFFVGQNLPQIQKQASIVTEGVSTVVYLVFEQFAEEYPTNSFFASFKSRDTVKIKHRKASEAKI